MIFVSFYLAIALVIILYFSLSFYVAYNGWVWLENVFSFPYKKLYIIIMALLSLSIFVDQLISSKIIVYVSGMWMVVIGYSLILLPIMNLLYFLLKKRGLQLFGGIFIAFFIFVFTYGSYLAWNPVVRNYEVNIDKTTDLDELTIMLVADLHLGKMIGPNHLQKLVDLVEHRKPDMVIMAGDLVDDHVAPFIKENMGETMAQIKAPLGVFATPGNHDHYGGDLEQIITEMEKAGITMLDDQVTVIEDSIYLVGRDDQTDQNRQKLDNLLEDLDQSKPIIMFDHQPIELTKAGQKGVDVFLAGHTHRGQLFPGNIITHLMFENDYGYKKINDIHTFVTSGFGFWGPPFRLGSQSEVFEITLRFD